MHAYQVTFTNGKTRVVQADSYFGANQAAKFLAFRFCTSIDTLRAI